MTALKPAALLIVTLVATHPASAQDSAAARAELAPTGELRVAIAVGPTPSGIYALAGKRRSPT